MKRKRKAHAYNNGIPDENINVTNIVVNIDAYLAEMLNSGPR